MRRPDQGGASGLLRGGGSDTWRELLHPHQNTTESKQSTADFGDWSFSGCCVLLLCLFCVVVVYGCLWLHVTVVVCIVVVHGCRVCGCVWLWCVFVVYDCVWLLSVWLLCVVGACGCCVWVFVVVGCCVWLCVGCEANSDGTGHCISHVVSNWANRCGYLLANC